MSPAGTPSHTSLLSAWPRILPLLDLFELKRACINRVDAFEMIVQYLSTWLNRGENSWPIASTLMLSTCITNNQTHSNYMRDMQTFPYHPSLHLSTLNWQGRKLHTPRLLSETQPSDSNANGENWFICIKITTKVWSSCEERHSLAIQTTRLFPVNSWRYLKYSNTTSHLDWLIVSGTCSYVATHMSYSWTRSS